MTPRQTSEDDDSNSAGVQRASGVQTSMVRTISFLTRHQEYQECCSIPEAVMELTKLAAGAMRAGTREGAGLSKRGGYKRGGYKRCHQQ
jgi:hypothetical protein